MSQTCERSTTEICGNDEHETCSWCLACVPDDELVEHFDGARVCAICQTDPEFREVDLEWAGF